jgi:hypothetical protein
MLDYKKLAKEADKLIMSYSAADLQAWIDMDNARMAKIDAEEAAEIARLNGVHKNKPKADTEKSGYYYDAQGRLRNEQGKYAKQQ